MSKTEAKIQKFGNSRGVLLPNYMLEKTGIDENVILKVRGNEIVISSADKPKTKWSDFKKVKQKVSFIESEFDKNEWTW